ncbi:hypothetical protein LSH36_401g00005 [Paralvinella palmiformis]|uniref:Uncharacterized protein n=1 Tax=Paralvinella palmiformis TaxID=53620 RepID=A0AAD9N195_9ANNE|nr:hypothetical protein LSH36_401g00005 [Paralvinella palmiformis]
MSKAEAIKKYLKVKDLQPKDTSQQEDVCRTDSQSESWYNIYRENPFIRRSFIQFMFTSVTTKEKIIFSFIIFISKHKSL